MSAASGGANASVRPNGNDGASRPVDTADHDAPSPAFDHASHARRIEKANSVRMRWGRRRRRSVHSLVAPQLSSTEPDQQRDAVRRGESRVALLQDARTIVRPGSFIAVQHAGQLMAAADAGVAAARLHKAKRPHPSGRKSSCGIHATDADRRE